MSLLDEEQLDAVREIAWVVWETLRGWAVFAWEAAMWVLAIMLLLVAAPLLILGAYVIDLVWSKRDTNRRDVGPPA
jgi:hypothetical protein